MDDPRSPYLTRARARLAAACLAPCLAPLLVSGLAACQSYEPRPLDPAAHATAWRGRTLEGASLAAFLERFEESVEGPAPPFDPTDGLDLREAQQVAWVYGPRLRLARLEAGLEAAGAELAGAWADPELSLDVLRITESVPDRWVVSSALTFSVPLSGSRGAARELAQAELDAAVATLRETAWDVAAELADAWLVWSAALFHAEETERFLVTLDELADVAGRLAERGELARTEAALFAIDRARESNRLLAARGAVAAAEQDLRARLGLAPDAPVRFLPAFELADDPGPLDDAELVARNPRLARLAEEHRVAERALEREIRRQLPDLVLGPQVESDEGQTRIGFLGALPLPVLDGNRRAIAEAQVARELARAAWEAAFEELRTRIAGARARVAAWTEQRADLRREVVPLVEAQLADAARLQELGESSGLVLLESVKRAHSVRHDLIDTRREEARARAELAFLAGPPAPEPETAPQTEPTTGTDPEERER